ncbi:MAG: alpha/beta hydrolase [Chloroflexi bacterium]|nr:alpha/beta hydrolase [Chloroflexota bacterium]
MPFVKSGDVNIYYEVRGQGDPLVMIMGLGGHLLQWGSLPDDLAKQYKVILMDNRGVGRSDRLQGPITMSMMVDDVASVLDETSTGKAHVFGVSMGGMIAQEFAIRHGDRLLNLVLGCTTCSGTHHIRSDAGALRILFDVEYLKSLTPEKRTMETLLFLCTEEFIDANPEIYQYYHKVTMDYLTPGITYKYQGEAVYKWDSWERLPDLKAPTMIITGTSDRIINPGNSKILAERIPGSELVLLQDKRHGFFIEARDSTRLFINGFMKRHGVKL